MFLLDYPYCKAELSDALQEKKKALTTREGGGTAPLSALIGDYLLPSHPFRLIRSPAESSICSYICPLNIRLQVVSLA